MTPLHLRRRLRSALTILRGVSPDEAAEVRAAYRVAYDCGDDEPIADLMRHVLDEVTYQKRARDATDRALAEAVEERDKLRTELADVDEALCAALDINPASLQAATMYAPGGVRRLAADRDVSRGEVNVLNAAAKVLREALRETAQERDEAVALISTVRAELAAAVEDEASVAATLARVMGELADVTRDRDALIAKVARLTGENTPKRKRTKEERQRQERERLSEMWTRPDSTTGMGWAISREIALMGPSTSRDIATRMWARTGAAPDEAEIRNDMRWVQDFARAGYLTVAKGPGGVRVYGLKEGA